MPEFDYPLEHFGWKPAETWFLEELDESLIRYFRARNQELAPGDRYKLIQAIFKAAFNEHKVLATIKIAISRIARRRDSTKRK